MTTKTHLLDIARALPADGATYPLDLPGGRYAVHFPGDSTKAESVVVQIDATHAIRSIKSGIVQGHGGWSRHDQIAWTSIVTDPRYHGDADPDDTDEPTPSEPRERADDLENAIRENLSPDAIALIASALQTARCNDPDVEKQVAWFRDFLAETVLGGFVVWVGRGGVEYRLEARA